MIIDGFTLLLFLFVVVMYGYFYFVRKSIVIPAAKHPTTKYLVAFFSLMILANAFSAGDKIEMIRSVLYILIIFSFLYDARGFAEDCIITHPFDNRGGTAFKDIEKIVLVQKSNGIRLGYLKKGRRGGVVLRFSAPLEEMVLFLSTRMNEEAEIDIIVNED